MLELEILYTFLVTLIVFITVFLFVSISSYIVAYYLLKSFIEWFCEYMHSNVEDFDKSILLAIFGPVRMGLAFLVVFLLAYCISMLHIYLPLLQEIASLLFFFVTTWFLFDLINLGFSWLNQFYSKRGQIEIVLLIPLWRRIVKGVIIIFVILFFLQNSGVQITALLAGLGVGGIAIALGAQKAIGDFIGGLILVFDRPIKIGDECRFYDKHGYIESIGLRSVRVRTPEKTLLIIPNSDFSQGRIENVSERDRILFKSLISVHQNTTLKKIQCLLLEFEQLLYNSSYTCKEKIRVTLIGFSKNSFDIEIQAYVLTNNYTEFLSMQENLLMDLMNKIKKLKINLAIPIVENIESLSS
ncbi:MAG: mechanosensitive ion channel [Deltaproteobacteria bacterium]|nr:MAG: mechanosensitive ion channel [Deltaproteobacteria bacterium]